jgi:hypothetical protein
MKGFGIEISVEEIKEIAPYISVNIVVLPLVLFILWHYRKGILERIQSLLKAKPLHKKIKCSNCKKKKFSPTHQNISEILRPSNVAVVGFYDYRSAGDFLICEGCRKVVGVWKSDNTLDQYKITERTDWNNLLSQHHVCFLAYNFHKEWIGELGWHLTFCLVQQLPTYEMEARVVNSNNLKSFFIKENKLQKKQ